MTHGPLSGDIPAISDGARRLADGLAACQIEARPDREIVRPQRRFDARAGSTKQNDGLGAGPVVMAKAALHGPYDDSFIVQRSRTDPEPSQRRT